MKRFLFSLSLIALMFFTAQTATAQFTFFNATPCPVRILGGFNYNANPCLGRSCTTNWVSVPGGSSVTLTGAGVPCLSPVFPPPPANFFGFRLLVSSTVGTSVTICNNPISTILDCNGIARTVQIFNFNNGAIF